MPPRHFKLATLYFFYFASLGIYLPYWAPYLRTLGFNATEIGELLAIALGTKVVAPYIWGWIADHTSHRLRMLRAAATLTIIFYAALLLRDSYAWLAVTLFLFSFFWNALLPQMESITMDSLGHVTRYYAKIRLWGSIGFIVCAMGFAPMVGRFGIGIVPYLILLTLVAVWLVSLRSVDRRVPPPNPAPMLRHLLRPEVLCLMVVCFTIQLTHSPYYGFFSIYMRDTGYSATLIGQLWALGVVAEVGIFMLMPALLSKCSAPALLSFSLVISALRWGLIAGFPEQLPVILFAQTLHAVSFGMYHAAAIHLVDRWFPGSLRGRGQAVYSSASFGLGGGLGSLLSGRLWDTLGGAEVFLLASAVSAVGVLLTVPLYRAR